MALCVSRRQFCTVKKNWNWKRTGLPQSITYFIKRNLILFKQHTCNWKLHSLLVNFEESGSISNENCDMRLPEGIYNTYVSFCYCRDKLYSMRVTNLASQGLCFYAISLDDYVDEISIDKPPPTVLEVNIAIFIWDFSFLLINQVFGATWAWESSR